MMRVAYTLLAMSPMARTWLLGLPTTFLIAAAAACSADSAASDFTNAAPESGSSSSSGSYGGASAAPEAGAPPEKEVESEFAAPVATGNIVWIANPKSGRVALIDATTLKVRTVEAGNGPTYLASVPAQPEDSALVLNVLSQDATLLRATASGITTTAFKTAQQANAMAFSKDGRYAIAWTNAAAVKNPRKTEGFQDLAVLDLAQKTSTILAVGYRPVTVGFAEGSARAYAVTQDGVALIDLTATPIVTKNVAISNTPNEDPGSRDVFVTKDGGRAFIRRDGSASITVVDLNADTRSDVTLTGAVTDLDLADTGERAVAVVRDTSEVAVLPIADPTNKTSVTVPGETFGAVTITPGGHRALLYTNAIAVERLTVLELDGAPSPRTVRLYSPVLGVFSTPDSQHAVVLHDTGSSTSSSSSGVSVTATPGAFSVVPIGQTLPAKIVATEAQPTAVATTNDRAIVAERNDTARIYGAYLARMPQLMVERYALASPPIAVGMVPAAKRAFVAQEHPEGRLTFIDLESGVARTLTGFELSSRVVDGSKP